MDLVISAKSDKPVYEQIYDQISAQILNGILPADLCLPSIRVVARELGVSIITIKKAWEVLEERRFIYTRAGKGCFVADHPETHRSDVRLSLARDSLRPAVTYCRNLGLATPEICSIVADLCGAELSADKDIP
jgi:GntR family transcriptional regulator